MAKKRDTMARRRQLAKARQTSTRKSSRSGVIPPSQAKSEERTSSKDLWLAVGIVVVVIAALVALYYLTVRRPAQQEPIVTDITVETPTPEEATPEVSEPTVANPAPTEQPTDVVANETPPTEQPTAAQTEEGSSSMSWSQPPEMTIDLSKAYEAVVTTTQGDFRISLFADKAPTTVNNFVFLARQGFYDGVLFHRVIPGFMAQTGDPTGTGRGGPGYRFEDEFDASLRHDAAGILSMANAGPGTNGSQFFITYAPQPHLDDHHSVFGRVVEGMSVVESITPREPSEDPKAVPGDKILKVDIIEQ